MVDYIGKREIMFSHFRCPDCCTHFKFDYGLACKSIMEKGTFTIGCPECDYDWTVTDVFDLPNKWVTFKDVD